MNFFQRFFGIFFNPKKISQTLASNPTWLDACVILLVVLLGFSYLIVPHTKMLNGVDNPSWSAILLRSVLLTHLYFLEFLVSSLVLLILGRLASRGGNYVQVFSLFVYANLIDKILGNAVRLFLMSLNESIFQATTSIAQFFPNMNIHSLGHAVAVQVDFFHLWLFGVLAFGLAEVFKMKMKKALCVSYGFWLLKAILNTALITFGMSIYG
ncbi:MAG: YIP1 family protein [Candidatus Aminicenantes bacterium]|nr:YIP1 family protein [Candidatus Aminicenantes bacterium]